MTALETTSLPPSTTTPTPTTSTTAIPGIDAEVLVPDGSAPFPAVVLAHGGGWVFGNPSDIRAMAEYLTEAGFLTINAAYKLSNQSPGFPIAVEDIACAVSYATSPAELPTALAGSAQGDRDAGNTVPPGSRP